METRDNRLESRSRSYRNRISNSGLKAFTVRVMQTDLHVRAESQLSDEVRDAIILYRTYIESHILQFPDFAETLTPWFCEAPTVPIIADMIKAANNAGVGPMAAVAGALSEYVGWNLLALTPQVIVENGGDVFIKTNQPVTVGVYAGTSPLSMRFGIRMDTIDSPASICTSSGTIGHSLSFGKADAVCVRSNQCHLADAAATAIANLVSSPKDIQSAINIGKNIPRIDGILVVIGDKIGAWGNLELVPI